MRLILAAAFIALCAAHAGAQTAASIPGTTPPRPLGPRAPKAANPFAVENWVSLEPAQGSLIRGPGQMDLAARENREYIQVYGRKKTPDLGPRRRLDGDEPAWMDVATPRELPLSNPTSCSNEAYQTIAGQPATGADMIGALARGC